MSEEVIVWSSVASDLCIDRELTKLNAVGFEDC